MVHLYPMDSLKIQLKRYWTDFGTQPLNARVSLARLSMFCWAKT